MTTAIERNLTAKPDPARVKSPPLKVLLVNLKSRESEKRSDNMLTVCYQISTILLHLSGSDDKQLHLN